MLDLRTTPFSTYAIKTTTEKWAIKSLFTPTCYTIIASNLRACFIQECDLQHFLSLVTKYSPLFQSSKPQALLNHVESLISSECIQQILVSNRNASIKCSKSIDGIPFNFTFELVQDDELFFQHLVCRSINK